MAAELFLAHGFVPGPRTLFAGVRKLAPASLLVWEDGALARASGPTGRPWDAGDPRSRQQLGRGPGAAARAAAHAVAAA